MRQTTPQFRSRPAVAAGTYYPSDPQALRRMVAALLDRATTIDGLPKAVIVPHAAYEYSAAIAASAYRMIAGGRQQVRRVVLLGPSHKVPVFGIAVPEVVAFNTPLGPIRVDTAALQSVAPLPDVRINEMPHRLEVSLEVQLPFLQCVLEDFALVPLIVGETNATAVCRVLDALWGGPETLIVISSDLSHSQTYRNAQQADAASVRTIVGTAGELSDGQASGAAAINGLLAAARSRSLHLRAIDLRNSGDTSNDRHSVVGYGAFAMFEA